MTRDTRAEVMDTRIHWFKKAAHYAGLVFALSQESTKVHLMFFVKGAVTHTSLSVVTSGPH